MSSSTGTRCCPSCGGSQIVVDAVGVARCMKCAAGFVSLEKATGALGLKNINWARLAGAEPREEKKSCLTCPAELIGFDAVGERVFACVACHGLWCSDAFGRRLFLGEARQRTATATPPAIANAKREVTNPGSVAPRLREVTSPGSRAPEKREVTNPGANTRAKDANPVTPSLEKREVTNPGARAPAPREVTNPRAQMHTLRTRPPDDGRRTARWLLVITVFLLAGVTTVALLRRVPATEIGGGATASFPRPPRVDQVTLMNRPAEKHEIAVDGVQLVALYVVGAGDSDPHAIRKLMDEALGGRALHEPVRSSVNGELIGSAELATEKNIARARAYVGKDIWILVVRGPRGLDHAVSDDFLLSLRPPAHEDDEGAKDG